MKGLIEFEHVRLKKERDAYKSERDEYKRQLIQIQDKDYFILSASYDSAFEIYDTFERAYKEGIKNKNEWLSLILHVSKINDCFFGEDIVGYFKNGKFIEYQKDDK
ncbi:hypothetical protein [Staphylococcus delphini]|uniref:hypothetical protein n=1 Tax=Staphylococcus delphini TaxID=53344 RepID=UPI003364ED75